MAKAFSLLRAEMVDRAHDFLPLQREYGIIKRDEPLNLEGRRRRVMINDDDDEKRNSLSLS